jgi:hypothetical protein
MPGLMVLLLADVLAAPVPRWSHRRESTRLVAPRPHPLYEPDGGDR